MLKHHYLMACDKEWDFEQFSSMVPVPAALISSAYLWKCKFSGPPRPTESDTLECVFNKPASWFWYTVKFEKQCFRALLHRFCECMHVGNGERLWVKTMPRVWSPGRVAEVIHLRGTEGKVTGEEEIQEMGGHHGEGSPVRILKSPKLFCLKDSLKDKIETL